MRTLLDTCVLSEIQRPQGNPRVRERLEALPPEAIFLSVLTLGGLRKGINKLAPSAKKKSLGVWFDQVVNSAEDRILPVDLETAVIWGEITASSAAKGRQIPAVDGLLAATALRHGLHLVTRNITDFVSTGVMLINPWEDLSAKPR
ncbi:Toxin FitB [Posidoniimonas polymericola]|uniref:Toxin FitB n=1 Tax=Posidoniimonas polymericola TaxID=2528002 RepID=A0A5C5YTP3_9BACT|nr:type II toxin-antitoxin system VapC family toxin [Posidoniimonas polymericola]TWT78382.1 Toxin FitB [Posidoniimonas polymericola]